MEQRQKHSSASARRLLTSVLIPAALLLILLFPGIAARAAAPTADQVYSRLNTFQNTFNNTFFNYSRTYDGCVGAAYGPSGHACANCNLTKIVTADWFKDMFTTAPSTSQFPFTGNGSQGFAAFAAWYLMRADDTDTVTYRSMGSPVFNFETASSMLQLGDILRFVDGDTSFYGIILGFNSEYISLLCINNPDSTDTYCNCVHTAYIKYTRYSAVTVYRPYSRTLSTFRQLGFPSKKHAVYYDKNGGTGTMSGVQISYGRTFTLKKNTYTYTDKVFLGWRLQRKDDSRWLASDGNWYTASQIGSSSSLKYELFEDQQQITAGINGNWITPDTVTSAFTFYAQWGEHYPVYRIYGSTRYDTAIAVANELLKLQGKSRFSAIVLATGEGFADALSGSYLAQIKGAPMLITNAKNASKVNTYIINHLSSGGQVYVLGGTQAIPASWISGLSGNGFTITRISGKTRYLTNLQILKKANVTGGNLLIATGTNYADALSASGVSLPILLVGKSLTSEQKTFLAGLTDPKFHILGGTLAVSTNVENALKTYGSLNRIAGDTRYETSRQIGNRLVASPDTAILVTGRNFPDGLAAGPLARYLNAPILLVNAPGGGAAADSNEAYKLIRDKDIENGIVLGGPTLITPAAVRNAFIISYDV